MIVLKPPAPIDIPAGSRSVFLAGSIEMGIAVDWQARVAAALSDREGVILNPRRDDWDASWRQSIDEPRFRGQVEWELDALDRADVIAMYLAACAERCGAGSTGVATVRSRAPFEIGAPDNVDSWRVWVVAPRLRRPDAGRLALAGHQRASDSTPAVGIGLLVDATRPANRP